MTLGNILFIGLFVVLPLVIVVWSLMTLRAFQRRPRYRIMAAERTEELPVVQSQPRGAVPATTSHTTRRRPARGFRPPAYRGRSGGVVRRLHPPTRQRQPARAAASRTRRRTG